MSNEHLLRQIALVGMLTDVHAAGAQFRLAVRAIERATPVDAERCEYGIVLLRIAFREFMPRMLAWARDGACTPEVRRERYGLTAATLVQLLETSAPVDLLADFRAEWTPVLGQLRSATGAAEA